ncbi:MAG: LytR/AlgR family response regulator transcription factor [Flavipsychrobacter sp.]
MSEPIGIAPIIAIEAFSAIIVDDEEDACLNLHYMLREAGSNTAHVAGIARNIDEATFIIKENKPEVVFLDIDLANDNAFTLLERLKPISFEIVFVTAYDEYAIKAFKLNAVDYIVKPIDKEDLARAIYRLQEKLSYKNFLRQYDAYKHIAEDISSKTVAQRITLRDKNTIEVVHFNDIVLIEAQRSYSKVIFKKNDVQQVITMSYSIAEYEDILPAALFFRIHKSYLINCRYIRKIIRNEQPYVVIDEQNKIPISRRRYTDFIGFLKSIDVNV